MLLDPSPIVLEDPARAGHLGRPRKQRGKRTLATVLRERGVLSTAHSVEVVLEICDALAVAHANGVVHGQLGLGCVRLAFTPETGPRGVEIFTLVAEADESGAVPAIPFVEPENLNGTRRAADIRSDVWALGALLHAMLVGKPPSLVEIPDDAMPRSLAAVVQACLSPDPELRPPTVDALAEKIASFATWPPDQFARIAERRDRRVAASA